MKILKNLAKEIIPLSRKQHVVLLVIIACIFQFGLFFAPALADEAVNKANAQINDEDIVISNDSMVKESSMGTEAAKITSQLPKSPEIRVIQTGVHTITAYNSEAGQTDDSPCITANGYNVCKSGVEDTIAANFLKFGTKVKIPELFGDRVFVVRDRMNKKHPERVDVWMVNHSDAIKFGVKVAKIEVIEVVK